MTDLVAVRSSATAVAAEQHALVLTAIGIRAHIIPDEVGFHLCVAPEDSARARENLDAYDEEEARRVRKRRWRTPFTPRMEAPLAYCAVMAFFYSASTQGAFGLDWFGAGVSNAGAVKGGEWWRTITALCLHADFGHLIGNLLAGSVIGLLLALTLGSGVTWLAVLVAGAAGNAVNALIHPDAHSSVGASTAIFAGLGLMAGFTQISETVHWHRGLRRWAPVAAGVALLVFMGTAGEKTDVWAHVSGFVVGGIGGLALGRYGTGLALRGRLQAVCGAASLLVIALSWAVGFAAVG